MGYFSDISTNANRISKTMLSGTDFSHTDATHSSSSDFNNFLNTLDDTDYDIDDDTTTTDWLTATTTILAGAANLTKELGTAFGGSSSATTDTTTPTATGGSDLSGAISKFESDPSDSNRSTLVDAVKGANNNISINTDRINDLNNQNTNLNEKPVDTYRQLLQDQAKTAKAEYDNANNALKDAKGAYESKVETLEQISIDLTVTTENHAATVDNQEKTITYKDNESNQITVKKSAAATEDEKIQELVSKYTECVNKRTTINTSIGSAQNNLDNAEKNLKAAQNSKNYYMSDGNGGYTVDTNKQEADIKAAQEQVKSAEQQLANVQKEKEDNEKKIQELEDKIQIGEKTLAQLKGDISVAEGNVAQAEAKIQTLGQQIAEYTDLEQTLSDNYAQTQDDKTKTQAEAESYSALVDKVADKETDLTEVLTNTEKLNKDAKEIYKQNKKEINNLTKENDRLQNDINRANNALASHPESGKSYNKGDNLPNHDDYTIEKHNNNGILVKKKEDNSLWYYDIATDKFTPKK